MSFSPERRKSTKSRLAVNDQLAPGQSGGCVLRQGEEAQESLAARRSRNARQTQLVFTTGWAYFSFMNTIEKLRQVIVVDREIMSGTPVFAGTRVPVQTLFDYLEAGDDLAEFLEDFPSVSQRQALRVLELSKDSLLNQALLPCA